MTALTTSGPTRAGRVAILVATVLVMVPLGSPAAHADLISGVCKLDLTFTFTGAVTLLGLPAPYEITNDSTNSHCVDDELTPTTTAVFGETDSTISLMRCGVLGGTGDWNQSWPGIALGVNDGSHFVAGTWLGGIMALSGFPGNDPERFNSVVVLTPHPSEPRANAKKAAKCAKGEAISSIRMLGVQVFVDPEEDDFQQLARSRGWMSDGG